MIQEVFPIDNNGFVVWLNYRFEPTDYIPQNNEITTPIPNNTIWHQPRWDRKTKQWVEGKDHPGRPTPQTPDTDIPTPESPDSGAYWLLNGNKSLSEMTHYLSAMKITAADITENSQHLCDTRIIPALIKIVQGLNEKVENVSNQLAKIKGGHK